MLKELYVKNIGIFDETSLEFKKGFTVITGETGSGKSLFVSALNLIAGAKANSSWIGDRNKEAVVCAVFDVTGNADVIKILSEHGFECNGDLILKRIIYPSGKSRAYINDSPVTLKFMKFISSFLFEIQSQREALKIFDAREQIRIFDRFAGVEELRLRFESLYKKVKELEKILSELEIEKVQRQRELELIDFQIKEIEDASLDPEEEIELDKKRNLFENMERIIGASNEALDLLSSDDGALSRIKLAYTRLASCGIEDFSSFIERLDGVIGELSDLVYELEHFVSKLDFDADEFEKVMSRINFIDKLKIKYGAATVLDILDYLDRIKSKKKELMERESLNENIKDDLNSLRSEMEKIGKELSNIRVKAAEKLEETIESILYELGFEYVKFKVDFVPVVSSYGFEKVIFKFTANPSLAPMPVNEVASGGELSRLLLALKLVLSGGVDTVIFDEIDTGVGGKTADIVGKKLRLLGEDVQVIAVSHFPQVASFAHNHVKVEKMVENGKANVVLKYLNDKERMMELERMIGEASKIIKRAV